MTTQETYSPAWDIAGFAVLSASLFASVGISVSLYPAPPYGNLGPAAGVSLAVVWFTNVAFVGLKMRYEP